MIRNSILILIIVGLGFIVWPLFSAFKSPTELNDLATYYVTAGPVETKAANMVTSIVLTYRGFDTLGEVTILFLAATVVGLMLKSGKSKTKTETNNSHTSELLTTSSGLLVPIIIIFGIYVFVNGHLTPGGGFQGGAIIASAMLLLLLADGSGRIRQSVFAVTESLSGFGFVVIGLLGLAFAGGFLDNSFLPGGTLGNFFSAGAIPLLYVLIGLKVGSELTVILVELKNLQEEKE